MSNMSKRNLTKDNHKEKPETIERFVSLSPSEYFMCLHDDAAEAIDKGQILLVTSIDFVDDVAHTVHVRLHPSKIQEYFNKTVKFLVADFLHHFEHVTKEQAKKDRDNSIADIQALLNNTQSELQSSLVDADLLDRNIERDLKSERPKENVASLPAQYEPLKADVVSAIKGQQVTALMNPEMTESGIEQIKCNLEHHKNIAVKRATWITDKTAELSKVASLMTPYFEEQSAFAIATAKEMTNHIDTIMKGIGNLNLYALKDVEMVNLKQGKSAPADVKLTIPQSVLFMDEELAVFKDIDESFDYLNRDLFFESLKDCNELVEQIFPTQRCIVGIAATRSPKDYYKSGYSLNQIRQIEDENNTVFFLIRDGENISVVLSTENFHQFSHTLFPSMDELEAPFRGIDGQKITYNDINYTKSLSAYKRIELSYKRLLILLCGLDHNKSLFGDFYHDEKSLDFVSMNFQEKYFNFIHDKDGAGLISNPYRPESYSKWISELNAEISSGSRVLILWKQAFDHESISGAYQRLTQWHRSDADRELLYEPVEKSKYLLGTVRKNNGRLVVDIEVEGENRDYVYRKFNTQIDIEVVLKNNNGRSIFCLDRFDVDNAYWYLQDRASRRLNVTGIMLLKKVIEFAKVERKIEKPVHDALTAGIKDSKLLTDDQEIKHLVDLALSKWRNANPNKEVRSLLNEPTKLNQLCDQIYQLSSFSSAYTDQIINSETSLGRNVLRITINAKGQYCAYSTPLASEMDNRLASFEWVVRTRYLTKKSGVKPQPSTYVLLPKRHNDETLKFEADNAKDHVSTGPALFKSPKHKKELLGSVSNPLQQFKELQNMKGDQDKIKALILQYLRKREEYTVTNTVDEPNVNIVLGHMSYYGSIYPVTLNMKTHQLISYLVNDNPVLADYFARKYAEMFRKERVKYESIQKEINDSKNSRLIDLFSICLSDQVTECNDDNYRVVNSHMACRFTGEEKEYSLQHKLDDHIKNKKPLFYLSEVLSDNIDDDFGIKEPENYLHCLLWEEDDGDSSNDSVYHLFPYSKEMRVKARSNQMFYSQEAALSYLSNLTCYRIIGADTDNLEEIKKRTLELGPQSTRLGVTLNSWEVKEIK